MTGTKVGTTTVENMRDGTSQVFTLSALDAVRAAYLQSIGNYNTWTYEYAACPPIQCGMHFFFCGDFAAKRRIA